MNLFFSKYKFIFYFAYIFLIILYIFPGSLLGCFIFNNCKIQPQITPNFIISSNHFYAFIMLCIIGIFTYMKSNKFNILVIYLFCLSIFLEIVHFLIPDRSFEFKDIFGNILGVSLPIMIYIFYVKFKNFQN